MNILLESSIIGIIVVIIGTIVGYILGKSISIDLPKVCKKWNKNHIMEICLFLTGFIVHSLYLYTKPYIL